MYLEIEQDTLYVAIATGLTPLNDEWRPGDIALDFGSDHSFEYGIVTAADSSYDPQWHPGIGNVAEIYAVDAWNVGIWKSPGVYNDPETSPTSVYQREHPNSIKAGTQIGHGEVVYSSEGAKYGTDRNPVIGDQGGKHYLIEAAIPLNLFKEYQWGQSFTVHWAMGCSNDWIQVDTRLPGPPVKVSEPGTLALLGLGLYALFRRQHAKKPPLSHNYAIS
jgi:hypothetical protein